MSIEENITRTEKGIIIHKLGTGETRKYLAVWGGISWPSIAENLPGYYCILGEEHIEGTQFKGREAQRGKLRFLCEYEAPNIHTSLTAFFTRLTDDATHYLCDTFYTVTEEFQGEDYSGHVEAFQSFVHEKNITGRLEQAPWADQLNLSLEHIKSWIVKGLLELPENSLVLNQLKMVEPDKVKQIPKAFNAVNGLRFVICGFEKYKPSKPGSNNWRPRVKTGSSWMTGGGKVEHGYRGR